MTSTHETTLTRRLLAACLCVSVFCATCGVGRSSAAAAPSGAKTSDEAARLSDGPSTPVTLAAWRPTADFLASASDTTEVEFPFEEEEEGKHLYRDIGIFLIVSAFVGYFIVEAFLKGDTEDEEPPKNGKDIPMY